MALHFFVRVDRNVIGYFEAQRREPLSTEKIYTYDVRLELNGVHSRTVVRHNYDDGAFVLILRALTAIYGAKRKLQ